MICKKTILSLCAAAVLLPAFTSCTNDETFDPLADGPVPMSFTADIDGVATRAINTGFEADDVVGIIPMKNGSVESAQENLAYTYNGSAFKANPPYYFQDRDAVTFNAYYPYYENLANDYTIAIDTRISNQNTEHGWRKNDYLFASAEADVKSPSVSYTADQAFKHVMSSIAFKFIAGTADGVTDLEPLTGYTLGSLVVDGTFDCSKGIAALTENETAESITVDGISCAEKETEHISAPLIVLPQDVPGGKFTLTVKYNNADYTATLTLDRLAAGTRYEFPVTIKNTGLEIGEAEIKDWESGRTYGGDATLE